ncbi:unnamed protein product [Clonostachys rosea f. rosea IK726]|uniref:Uncharacterized protein n=1 Tax=Clonostachys rosea f. rosea IK726 TaxID=1349383 RepID=A0ACA9TVA5_BIOOC|nr:unnamed protein product [Clonostachys rosea f. rosea IK726]
MKFSALIPFFLLSTGIVARQSTDADALIARGEYLIARGERLIARASSSKAKDPKKGKKEPPAVKVAWMGGARSHAALLTIALKTLPIEVASMEQHPEIVTLSVVFQQIQEGDN